MIFLVVGAAFCKFHGLECLNILFPLTTDAGFGGGLLAVPVHLRTVGGL